MSPAELADEYGCTNGHVRNTLRELREDDLADRVGRGQYVALDSDESAEMDSESPEMPTPTAPDEGEEVDTDFPEGGEARSEDHDTTDQGDQEDDEAMVSEDELAQQRDQWSLADDRDDDDQEESDDGEQEDVEDEPEPVAVEQQQTAGIPIPVGKTTLFVGVAALAAVVIWYTMVKESDSGGDDEQEQQAQQSQQTPSGSGLTGTAPSAMGGD